MTTAFKLQSYTDNTKLDNMAMLLVPEMGKLALDEVYSTPVRSDSVVKETRTISIPETHIEVEIDFTITNSENSDVYEVDNVLVYDNEKTTKDYTAILPCTTKELWDFLETSLAVENYLKKLEI